MLVFKITIWDIKRIIKIKLKQFIALLKMWTQVLPTICCSKIIAKFLDNAHNAMQIKKKNQMRCEHDRWGYNDHGNSLHVKLEY